ncbi:tripartite tricarboxylate transporter substrate binding protein [Vibrio injensis]|uniref:tripartite tricarboxylate transporter substrate binding protein n=1 Tax=Vibrio injensis TaxID=1307414 RepID=UPI00278C26B4|nr:tripartite tricarboxylate transporter substrate binding protein [Vibrio injensis]
MRQTKRLTQLLWLLLLSVFTLPAFTQSNFPSQPLTMLIGFNPGGSTDIQGQVLAKVLSEKLGQPVNIIYHPGAGGASAAAMLANSRDQGYTFQFGLSLPYTFAPLATPASYQLTSFRYVAGITLDQIALVTGPNTPFATWAEFITYAKANPGLVYASQNIQDRFVINRIMRREGIILRVMPTTGGAGMAPLILSGDADLAFSGGTHSAYTDSGLMRVLASLADERLVHYPEVPNLRELGYDVSMHAIRVIAVPANTPDDQVDILSKALQSAIQDARFKQVTEETIKMPIIFMDEPVLIELFNAQVKEYKQLISESR